jgi:hypothetical protein
MKIAHIGALFLFVAFIGVSTSDYKDEVREHLAYCENVNSGVWPDFKEFGSNECGEQKIAELEEFLR